MVMRLMNKPPEQGSCGKGFPQHPVIVFLAEKRNISFGNVKYCRRNVIYALGHVAVSLGDGLNNKMELRIFLRNSIFHLHFRGKYITGEAYLTHQQVYFTDLQRKSISLLVGHIPMANQLMPVAFLHKKPQAFPSL